MQCEISFTTFSVFIFILRGMLLAAILLTVDLFLLILHYILHCTSFLSFVTVNPYTYVSNRLAKFCPTVY